MTIGQALLSFTLAAGLLTITPGLDTALVLRTAAVEGGKQAFLAGVGICFGCLLWGAAASFGLRRTARSFRARLQRAPDRWRYLSELFGN
jgi:threonine/homoserine/homoserine lactone efflux protein